MNIPRILDVLAVIALIASAGAAYRVKYEATWQSEQVSRLERAIGAEEEAIRVLRAEIAHLSRPDRIQRLAETNLELKPLDPAAVVAADKLPARPPREDAIAKTLESLGLFEDILVPGGDL